MLKLSRSVRLFLLCFHHLPLFGSIQLIDVPSLRPFQLEAAEKSRAPSTSLPECLDWRWEDTGVTVACRLRCTGRSGNQKFIELKELCAEISSRSFRRNKLKKQRPQICARVTVEQQLSALVCAGGQTAQHHSAMDKRGKTPSRRRQQSR